MEGERIRQINVKAHVPKKKNYYQETKIFP